MSQPLEARNTTVRRKKKGANTMKELTELVCVVKNHAMPVHTRRIKVRKQNQL